MFNMKIQLHDEIKDLSFYLADYELIIVFVVDEL